MVLFFSSCSTLNNDHKYRDLASKKSLFCKDIARIFLSRDSKEWRVSSKVENELRLIFNDSSLDPGAKVRAVVDKLIDIRIKENKEKVSKRVYEILKDAKNEFSNYKHTAAKFNLSGINHFHPVFRKVLISTNKPYSEWGFSQSLVLLHEMSHAIYDGRRRSYFYIEAIENIITAFTFGGKVIGPMLSHINEHQAIGSQWELVSRIPVKMRKELLELFEINRVKRRLTIAEYVKMDEIIGNVYNPRVLEVVEYSLKYADLEKKEFVKKMLEIHKYTVGSLYRDAYKLTTFRKFYIYLTVAQVLYFIYDDDHHRLKLPPFDTYYFLKLYLAFIE
jgi:hypothetical protein